MSEERLAEYFGGKNVLVTGGAGFIGSHVVEMLVPLGASVSVTIRQGTDLSFLAATLDRIRLIEADLFDRDAAAVAAQGQDVVLNLAAAKGGGIAHSMRHHGSLFRDNMLSFINMLEGSRNARIGRFLVVSSACVYPRDAQTPTPEEEGFRDAPEPTNSGYGWSKRMEEYLAQCYVAEFGMNIGIARPFNAYGPRDDFFRATNHVIPGLITRVLDGENSLRVWGTGQQTRSFLYVTDFARGLLEVAAAEDCAGPVNLGSNQEVTIGELAQTIVELSGKDLAIEYDTSKPDGQPRRACDTRRARAEIGFEARTPLRVGLDETLKWYLAARDSGSQK